MTIVHKRPNPFRAQKSDKPRIHNGNYCSNGTALFPAGSVIVAAGALLLPLAAAAATAAAEGASPSVGAGAPGRC